ncbi:hypothetical protein Tco_1042507 [Tanacetum coccineum]|uniref:Uncharacterized protein n=1 Tax=Tanacetum coccineum TaxID=301880 RepID=A0ABQ5GJA9_9ASTR
MLPTMSSNSPQAGNAAVSEFFAEFDALKKEVLLIKRPKMMSDELMLRTIKPKDDFRDEAYVDSYDDDYMSLFNDEEQPAKSSLNDLELQQEPDKSMIKDQD